MSLPRDIYYEIFSYLIRPFGDKIVTREIFHALLNDMRIYNNIHSILLINKTYNTHCMNYLYRDIDMSADDIKYHMLCKYARSFKFGPYYHSKIIKNHSYFKSISKYWPHDPKNSSYFTCVNGMLHGCTYYLLSDDTNQLDKNVSPPQKFASYFIDFDRNKLAGVYIIDGSEIVTIRPINGKFTCQYNRKADTDITLRKILNKIHEICIDKNKQYTADELCKKEPHFNTIYKIIFNK